MALATTSANQARQKAYNAVYGTGTGTSTDTVSPYHFFAVKSFFLFWAMNHGNGDLQFLPYAAEDITTNGGYQPIGSGACTLYVWFGKARRTTGTTASFQQIFDSADNTTGTATLDTVQINKTGQQFIVVHPNGMPVTTELTIAADTAVAGATESQAADATDGFVIVGA